MLLHMILGDAQSIPSSPVLPPSAPVLFFFFSFKGTSPASAPLFRSISETFRIISEIVRRWLVCFRSLPLLLLLHSVVGTGNSSSKKGLEPYEAFSPSRMKNARYIRNQDRKGGRVGSENRGGGSFLTASFQVDGRQKPPPKGGPKPSPKGGPFDEVIVRRTRCTQNFAGFWRHQSVLVVFRASCAPDPGAHVYSKFSRVKCDLGFYRKEKNPCWEQKTHVFWGSWLFKPLYLFCSTSTSW
jgi:hypothetical protein